MIDVSHIAKIYHSDTRETYAIGDASFTVAKGEFVSIVGPSGCGKSTLLNMVASFMAPSSGSISVNGQRVVPGQIPKGLGYIFQKDTVLPWFTVARNIGLGLKFRGVPQDEIDGKVDRLLAMAGLKDCHDMFPHHLSGGMRQRVALLMTLACDPDILLLDEPFGALDALTRAHLQDSIMQIHATLGNTMIMITHDVDEAVLLSDRIVMMTNGPSARIGEVLDVRLARPRKRLDLVSDRTYIAAREAVLKFLYERHRFVEAA